MVKQKRLFVSMLLIGMLLIMVVPSVMAYQRLCLEYGQSVPNDDDPRYTCHHDICQICVTDSFYPTKPSRCNDISGCQIIGDGGGIDQDPPELVVNSPLEGEVYDSRMILFDLSSDEPSSFYYIDNVNGRGKWKKMASNVYDYSNERSLKDGLNDLTFRAVDRSGNFVEVVRAFYVDSKSPKISKTEIDDTGNYYIEFKEENPVGLVLNYGNSLLGYSFFAFEIDNMCVENRGKYICETQVSSQQFMQLLTPYSGQMIEYWFELTDIAGSIDESKKTEFFVDLTAPVISSLEYMVEGRYAYFDIEVIEDRLDEITYIDREDSKAKENKLCSRLTDNKCSTKISFKDGFHDILIKVTDEAGNFDKTSFEFFTDSKKPKISKTYPKKGFANGVFSVDFTEENPVELILNYGNSEVGFREAEVDLSSCSINRGKYYCDVSVGLNDYDGQEIEYWFKLIDRVNQIVESKIVKLDVDITGPVLLNPDDFWSQGDGRNNKYIYFDMKINEPNLDEVSYYDWNDRRPKWKKICSRLKGGECEKKVRFKKGEHRVDIQITDEAGNAVSASRIEFEVV